MEVRLPDGHHTTVAHPIAFEEDAFEEIRVIPCPCREVAALREDRNGWERTANEHGVALTALEAALERQVSYWMSVPGGPDEDADPKNPSPKDATAHLAGLAIREARAALAQSEPAKKEGT